MSSPFLQQANLHISVLISNTENVDKILSNIIEVDLQRMETELSDLQQKKMQLQRQLEQKNKNHTVRRHLAEQIRHLDDGQLRLVDRAYHLPREMHGRIKAIVSTDRQDNERDNLEMAYRLSGKSVFKMQNGAVGIRFETFFRGRYFETFYVYLRLDKSKKFTIENHTIPSFIPLAELEAKYLNTDLQMFMNNLCDLLHAFISRREQFEEMKRQPDVSEFLTTPAYTLVQFVGTIRKKPVQFNFSYNIDESLPKKRVVFVSEADEGDNQPPKRRRILEAEELFGSKKLQHAFSDTKKLGASILKN
eukprot:TRINITY_DN44_c0_g2_i1.p1 TRINITY_DN44_c0_g2~~TRINITY_DN44_c0_g2_i1.p1  ORF type:complete len:305 (+),score=58.04 TRINITY_DN44_c0_g2_i1:74-988(+)